MSRVSGVEALVRSALRRRLFVLVIEEAALPCAVALAGVAVLLVLGTDILNWFWPLLLGAMAAAFAVFRVHVRTFPPYRMAQVLDQRLGLQDSLATAWFLLSQRSAMRTAAAEFQIGQAEQAACSIRPAAALPSPGRRRWFPAIALLVLALTLGTVRYSKIEHLSLRQPLVQVQAANIPILGDLFRTDPVGMARLPDGLQRNGRAANTSRLQNSSAPDGDSSASAVPGNAAKPGGHQNQHGRAAGAASNSGLQKTALPPSLFRQAKNALASLAADLRGSESGRGASHKSSQEESTRSPAQTSSASSLNNGQRGAGAKSAAMQKQGPSLSSSQTTSGKGMQSRSGIGRQNGDKELQRAADLAAMGKLAQILGKRSADLTGDISVQSVPGAAALRTPDTGRLAQHGNAGGEIRRDEVPPMYRDYVRQYMEEVRSESNK